MTKVYCGECKLHVFGRNSNNGKQWCHSGPKKWDKGTNVRPPAAYRDERNPRRKNKRNDCPDFEKGE